MEFRSSHKELLLKKMHKLLLKLIQPFHLVISLSFITQENICLLIIRKLGSREKLGLIGNFTFHELSEKYEKKGIGLNRDNSHSNYKYDTELSDNYWKIENVHKSVNFKLETFGGINRIMSL